MEAPRTRCDVVIVTHNSEAEILACLSHLQADDTLSVTVVDSGSDDLSWTQRGELAGATVLSIRNYGYGTSLNVGARLGSAPWLVLMNPDTSITAGQVAQLVATAEERGAAAIGPASMDQRGNVRNHHGTALKPYWARSRPPHRTGTVREVEMIPGALLIVARSAFDEVAGFDESFFLYSEEDDLVTRLRAAGHAALVRDDIVVLHKGEQSSIVSPAWRAARRLRGEYRYLCKHWSWWAALATVAIDLVRTCAKLPIREIPRLLIELSRDPRRGLPWPPEVRTVRS